VPHRGTPDAIVALVRGDVAMFVSGAPAALQFERESKVKLLAITGEKRLEQAPHIPTTTEIGLAELQIPAWYGIVAPKGTPKEVTDRFGAAVGKALANPAVQEKLKRGLYVGLGTGPKAFADRHAAETAKWRKVIADAKIRIE
jgi:tripartite-type tricarboxylate transporter receptor subunit TctC